MLPRVRIPVSPFFRIKAYKRILPSYSAISVAAAEEGSRRLVIKRLIPTVVAVFILAGSSAFGSTPSHYVGLAKKFHAISGVSASNLQNDPQDFANKVVDLKGTVVGQTGISNDLMLILSCAGGSSLIINHVKSSEATVLTQAGDASVRVLARVVVSSGSNQPELDDIAIALDSAVSKVELARSQRQAELHREALLRQRILNSSQQPARGSVHRLAMGISGNALAQLQFYSAALDERTRPLFAPYFQFIATRNGRLDDQTVGKITYYLLKYSEMYAVDPRLVVAMIIAESDFDPQSTSSTGAAGLGQLMPGTGKMLGLSNPYDIEQNLDGSIRYLKTRLEKFANAAAPDGSMTDQQIKLCMAAYNAGVSAVIKYGGVPPFHETQTYVRRVLSYYHQLCSNG